MLPEPVPPRPTYTAAGALTFEAPTPAFTATGSQLQQQSRAIDKDTLLSERVLRGVMGKLKLTTEEIVKIRDKNLTVTLPDPKKSPGQAILLQYTNSESPTQAVLVLETFMKEMIAYSRWLNTAQLRGRIDALSKRLAQTQKDLTAAEEKFYRYITKQGSDILAIQDGSLFSSITSSQQRQRELNLALQQLDGQINSLQKQLGLNPKQAYTSVALSADPIIAGLRSQIWQIELNLQRAQQDYRPEHPTVVRLLKQKQSNEILLQQRASELIGARELTPVTSEIRQGSNLDPSRQQLAYQLVYLQVQREGLAKQLKSVIQTDAKLRQQYEKFPTRQLQQARLVQGVEFQRVIYQNILTALVDAQAAEAETSSSLIVAQEPFYQPAPPFQAKKLNPKLILAAGAGIGTLAGLGLILLLALLDDRLQTPEELRDALTEREVTFLGQLPWIATSLSAEHPNPVLLDGDSIYLPFYERIRSNLRRLRPDSSRVILIASITNEEGKSVTAYNLAVASAYAGRRTLLVEADLRAASKAEWLEVTPDPAAVLEPLRYYAARSEAISLVPGVANLYVLPSPGPQRDAAAIIESSEFQMMLKDVRGRFDMVIVDVSSLSRCNDALLIEPMTDGIVLVVRPGITRSSLLREATNQFIEAEIPVLGAVINGVEGLATPLMSAPPTHPEAEPLDSENEVEEEAGVRL
jgi:capsular exopolysaccharide synthesis family protein